MPAVVAEAARARRPRGYLAPPVYLVTLSAVML